MQDRSELGVGEGRTSSGEGKAPVRFAGLILEARSPLPRSASSIDCGTSSSISPRTSSTIPPGAAALGILGRSVRGAPEKAPRQSHDHRHPRPRCRARQRRVGGEAAAGEVRRDPDGGREGAGSPVQRRSAPLNAFLAALLVRTASALPFNEYPYDGRYRQWRLLGFAPPNGVGRGEEAPLEPNPASLAVFRQKLFSWAHPQKEPETIQ